MMGYRGEDLDLRTPQMGTRPLADLTNGDIGTGRQRAYGARGETIWVDDTVLACSNLAYDLAVTHRAGEVRIEHLIYALTRIDAAAETLEARGIRVAALRREMGSIVASEIPIGLPNGKGTPRRSEELEILLREAADNAARRSAPAGVDDVVAVLVDTARDLPGLTHLRRHLTTRTSTERDYEPLVRSREVRTYTPPSYESRAWTDPTPLTASRTDAVQNSRIEALEQVVRSLGTELASERKTTSNLLLDIQRDVGSRRDEDNRLSGGVIERLGAVEHAIEKRLTEISRSWNVLNDRLQLMEQALTKARPDTAADLVALHDRLTGIERGLQGTAADDSRHWALIGDRLKALEATIGSRSAQAAGPELARLSERFDLIEHVLLERTSEATTEASKLAEKLKTIEEAQAAQKIQAMQLNAALATEVAKLTSAVSQQQLPGVDKLMPALNDRFQSITSLIERQKTDLSSAGIERLMPMITERFQVLGAMMERQRGELAATLVQPVGERLNAVVAPLAERLGAIEQGMGGYVQKVTEQSAAYDEDIDQIQDALVTINTHQSATVASLEQWHQQANELGIISNRLAALERLSMRPTQMIEQLTDKIDAMHRVIAEKAEKRNRFYYWLFGTSSWLSASWPNRQKETPASPAVAVQRQAPPSPR